MRTLDMGLAAHLAAGETTLATCWRIERADGLVLGFTDHDLTLTFGGVDYRPGNGLDAGEVAGKLGAQVETSEILGVIDDAAIGEDDILLGRYDGAVVETWRVNWADASQRLMLRRDTIGEIVREDGVFRAELRSGQHRLNAVHGRVYHRLCDAEVGDVRCGVDLDLPAFTGFGTVVAVRDQYRIAVGGLAGFAEGWFGLGKARWSEGRRAGLQDGVMSHGREDLVDVLAFALPVGDWVLPGDAVTLMAGCDRRFATCRQKFGNGVNFRGFPHSPGSDYVLRYPRAGDALDGRAVVR